MKRFVAVSLALVVALSAFAQGTFTIRRPMDGSTVRETVKVRIPKNSIPEGGYLGIVVNGKFIEATVPDVEGSDYVYDLDSKKRGLADGKLTIEAVLYVDYGKAPQVVNRSSVTVTLDNSSSIKIPGDGLHLRYAFRPGTEFTYKTERSSTISFLSQAQAQLGSRAAEIPTEIEDFRLLYAVDNAYPTPSGRDGLLRLQGLPTKGKDYAYIVIAGDTEARKYMDYEMQPIYMKLTNTGREEFGSLPTYFAPEGTSGEAMRLDLYALFTLPVLPTKAVKPGDVWQAPYLQGNLDLEHKDEIDKLTTPFPSRGVFEGVEWQDGMPCARIRQTIAVGERDLRNVKAIDQLQGQARSFKLEQVFWFALDRGMLAKSETTYTIEALVDAAATQGAPTGTGGSRNTGDGRPGIPGRGDGGGRRGGAGEDGGGQDGKFIRQRRPVAASGAGGGSRPPAGVPGQFGAPGRPAGGSSNTKQIIRLTRKISLELEK